MNAAVSPRPWKLHRTGSHLGVKDAKGRFVIRKAVNNLSIAQFEQLLADFEALIAAVNQAAGS